MASSPTPFSPRDPLRDTPILGHVVGFDPLSHAQDVTLGHYPWDNSGSHEEVAYLNDDGRFSFTPRLSVIQQYWLVYNGRAWNFLPVPGEALRLEIYPAREQYRVEAPDGGLTAESLRVLPRLLDGSLYDDHPGMQAGVDIGAYRAAVAQHEGILAGRLAELCATGAATEPRLLEWCRQHITYGLKRDVQLFPLVATRQDGPERERLFAQATYPELAPRLEEQPVYADGYRDYVVHSEIIARRNAGAPDHHTEGERRLARFERRDAAIGAIEHPLTRDLLRADLYGTFLTGPEEDAAVLAAARTFADATPFPLLGEPVAALLGKLSAPVEFVRRLEALPIQVDNPFPELLARHAGQVVVVDFWATWCGPCRAEFGFLYPPLLEKYAGAPVAFVFLSLDTRDSLWRATLEKLPPGGQHLRLTREQVTVATALFGLGGIPHHLVFGRDGRLAGNRVAPGDLDRIIAEQVAAGTGAA